MYFCLVGRFSTTETPGKPIPRAQNHIKFFYYWHQIDMENRYRGYWWILNRIEKILSSGSFILIQLWDIRIGYAFKIVCPKNVQTVALLGIHRPLGQKKLSYYLVQLPITLPFRKLRPRELRCFIQCWCRVSDRGKSGNRDSTFFVYLSMYLLIPLANIKIDLRIQNIGDTK